MRFIDLHCDTLMECYLGGAKLTGHKGHIDIPKLKAGEAMAQCFAIFVPWNDYADKSQLTDTPYEYYKNCYKVYLRELEENKASLRPALTVADLEENRKNGFISSILTLEDSVHLDGDISRVDELHQMGVRIASLTWNWENSLAYPNSRDPEKMALGLKPFGLEAVQRMNQLGIIVDVSHLSDGGFWDIIKHSSKPFVATHSCARALCGHPRNLTDDMLKALGEKGGVVGVNFCHAFIDEASTGLTTIDGIVRHLKYMGDKAGVDALAMGSDFDGINSTLEIVDYSGMPRIAQALKAHFTESQIDKICYGNAMRVFKECWK